MKEYEAVSKPKTNLAKGKDKVHGKYKGKTKIQTHNHVIKYFHCLGRGHVAS